MEESELNIAGHHKADILFLKSFIKLKRNYRWSTGYQLMKTLIFVIFIPLDLTLSAERKAAIIVSNSFALGVSLLAFLFYIWSIRRIFSRVITFLEIAADTRHATHEYVQDVGSFQEATSQEIFIASSQVSIQSINQNVINIYVSHTVDEIQRSIQKKFICLDRSETVVEFLTFSSMILSIIMVGSVSDLNASEKSVIGVYIALEGLSKLKIMAFFGIIGLSPVVCIILLIYAVFFYKKSEEILSLEEQVATMNDIIQANGGCAICLSNFKVNDKVYILPCSHKHMFHTQCLRNWTRIKKNCPSCRASLPINRPNTSENE